MAGNSQSPPSLHYLLSLTPAVSSPPLSSLSFDPSLLFLSLFSLFFSFSSFLSAALPSSLPFYFFPFLLFFYPFPLFSSFLFLSSSWSFSTLKILLRLPLLVSRSSTTNRIIIITINLSLRISNEILHFGPPLLIWLLPRLFSPFLLINLHDTPFHHDSIHL